MSTANRVIEILLNQKKPGIEIDMERLGVLVKDPDAEVDWEEVQDALGYSSLQLHAFLNGLNAEFGKEITAEEFTNTKGPSALFALLE